MDFWPCVPPRPDYLGVPPLGEVVSAPTVASNREPASLEWAVHPVVTGNHGTPIDSRTPPTSVLLLDAIRPVSATWRFTMRGGPARRCWRPWNPPAGHHAVRCHADVSMTWGSIRTPARWRPS